MRRSGALTANTRITRGREKGFDLALDEINASGGIKGAARSMCSRTTRATRARTVNIARKYVADERVVCEIGDFSSAASMAARRSIRRPGVVQFGFSNSHPDFTKGATTCGAMRQPGGRDAVAGGFLRDLGLKKVAILHLNSDWGRTAKELLVAAIKGARRRGRRLGGYLADEKDFRSAIVRCARQPGFDPLIHTIPTARSSRVRSARARITQPIAAAVDLLAEIPSNWAASRSTGVLTTVPFFPDDPRPVVRRS